MPSSDNAAANTATGGSRSWFFSSLLAGVVVGLMAEISIHPFGTAFRFSLGPVTLAFVALFFPTLPAYLAGLSAGLLVPLVHAAFALARAPASDTASLLNAAAQFLPETLAYALMGSLFSAFRVRERTDTPLLLAGLLACADLITNVVETRFRGDALHLLPALTAMALVAVGRALVAEGAAQRRLEIARALATKPNLLLLDEPKAGMNPRETDEIMAVIRRLRDDLGITILLIEHDMKMVMTISDRIAVLDYGTKIAEGRPDEVRRNPAVIEAYLGKGAAS